MPGGNCDRSRVKIPDIGNEHSTKIVMPRVRQHVGQETRQVFAGANLGEHAHHACHDAGLTTWAPRSADALRFWVPRSGPMREQIRLQMNSGVSSLAA